MEQLPAHHINKQTNKQTVTSLIQKLSHFQISILAELGPAQPQLVSLFVNKVGW